MAPASPPDNDIQSLIDLISNTTEAFTTALFLAAEPDGPLKLTAYQSLSQNINKDVSIGPGEGLVGWAYKNLKPVNVNQFDQDTRRLLFYLTDESIKSFMAVPLPEVNGVLAVDSKQQYVFTEKSLKILHQFGQILKLTITRVRQIEEGRQRDKAMNFLNMIGEALYRRDRPDKYLNRAAGLIREFAEAKACFIAGVIPEDRTRYRLLAQDARQTDQLRQDIFIVDQGLIGWIMKEKKPLILKKTRLGTEKSYLFYPDEPFAGFTSFAGLPLIWGGRLLGAVCLGGDESLRITDISAQALETAADRLAVALEMELLISRIGDLSRLDSQTGLPHRTEFCRRVDRMINSPLSRSSDIFVIIIKLINLETINTDPGPERTEAVLKAVAEHLLNQTSRDIELGHLDYGVFGLAIPNRSGEEVRQIRTRLTETLVNTVASGSGTRARLQLRIFTAKVPPQTKTAGGIINQGLTSMQKPIKSPAKTEVDA